MKRRKERKPGKSAPGFGWIVSALLLLAGAAIGGVTAAAGGTGLLARFLAAVVVLPPVDFKMAFWREVVPLTFFWAAGLLPIGFPLLAAGLLLKGTMIGYQSASLLLTESGLKNVMVAVFPAVFCLLLAWWATGNFGFRFVLFRFVVLPPRQRLRREKQRIFAEYLLLLAGGWLAAVFSALLMAAI